MNTVDIFCPECGHKMRVERDNLAGDFYAQCDNKRCSFDGANAPTLAELPKVLSETAPLG